MVLTQDADDALGLPTPHDGGLETRFDAAFAARLALPEKQIQQNYRPIIGVHKWFARRPGTLFRNLLFAEFVDGPTDELYWTDHHLTGTIADPFMGGGTPLIEANRLGFDVVGADVNPMAYWIVRQSLRDLDIKAFLAAADDVASEVEMRPWVMRWGANVEVIGPPSLRAHMAETLAAAAALYASNPSKRGKT